MPMGARLVFRPRPTARYGPGPAGFTEGGRRLAATSLHGPVARGPCSRYINRRQSSEALVGIAMRAEVQKVIDEIKQSVALLRRHL